MLTWEFMTIDIDFLMFSEFFWYVLLFWGFCRYMSHDHCHGLEDNRAALGTALLLDPVWKDGAIRCIHLEIFAKELTRQWWLLMVQPIKYIHGSHLSRVSEFLFLFFRWNRTLWKLGHFFQKKSCIFWVFWGVPAGCLGVDGIPTGDRKSVV